VDEPIEEENSEGGIEVTSENVDDIQNYALAFAGINFIGCILPGFLITSQIELKFPEEINRFSRKVLMGGIGMSPSVMAFVLILVLLMGA